MSPLKRPELLAPAGDWECARAAVENGADAAANVEPPSADWTWA